MTTTAPIALITGGSRGLGKNAALALAQQGTDIILTYQQNAAAAQAVISEIEWLGRKAVALPLDVADSSSFAAFTDTVRQQLQQHWQRSQFDFLVNNAGIGIHVPMIETSVEQFDLLMNIHVKGPFFLTQQLLPLLADGGRIVNVSTGLTRFATFWVENGQIQGPVSTMRFDDSLYSLLGSQLEDLTREREMILSTSTYGQRSTGSSHLPGALVKGLTLTL